MQVIAQELLLEIIPYLSDSGKLNLIKCSKHTYSFRDLITLSRVYEYDDIMHSYLGNLISVKKLFLRKKCEFNFTSVHKLNRIFQNENFYNLEVLYIYASEDIFANGVIFPQLKKLFICLEMKIIPKSRNYFIDKKTLPCLKKLIFDRIDSSIDPDVLVDLTHLVNIRNNRIEKLYLPKLRVLKLGYYFDHYIDFNLIPNLITVSLVMHKFDQLIIFLPSSLRNIFFSKCCIPCIPFFNNIQFLNLTELKLGLFNKSLNENYFPRLERLTLNETYNLKLNPENFPSLKYLKMGKEFNQKLGTFPSLEKLILGFEYSYPLLKENFPKLNNLSIKSVYDICLVQMDLPNLLKIKLLNEDTNIAIRKIIKFSPRLQIIKNGSKIIYYPHQMRMIKN